MSASRVFNCRGMTSSSHIKSHIFIKGRQVLFANSSTSFCSSRAALRAAFSSEVAVSITLRMTCRSSSKLSKVHPIFLWAAHSAFKFFSIPLTVTRISYIISGEDGEGAPLIGSPAFGGRTQNRSPLSETYSFVFIWSLLSVLRTCGSRPILTTNLTTNEIPLVSTDLGKTLENRAFAGTLVPVFYSSCRVRIPPTAPEKPERCHAVHTAWHQASFPAGSYDTPTAPELSGPLFSIGFHHAGHTPEEGVHFLWPLPTQRT